MAAASVFWHGDDGMVMSMKKRFEHVNWSIPHSTATAEKTMPAPVAEPRWVMPLLYAVDDRESA
jgi:hypothetical protein